MTSFYVTLLIEVAVAVLLIGIVLAVAYLTWRQERSDKTNPPPFTGSDFWREFDNVQTVAGALRHVIGVDPEVGR